MRPQNKTPFFDLKQNYLIYFEACLIVSLATFIGLCKLHLPANTADQTFDVPAQEILRLEAIALTSLPADIPEPPPAVVIPITPIPDIILEEHLRDIDLELSELNNPLALPEEEIFTEAETNSTSKKGSVAPENIPFLIGGISGLQKRLKYPPKAVKDKVEGRVVIKFVVDRKGKVRNPEVIKGVRYDINNEAVRAVSRSRFRPAQLDGNAIPVEHVLHILFRIEYNS